MTDPNATISQQGVSIWLDDLSRDRILTGNLEDLIETRSIVGVTTNPTIFNNAISKGSTYADLLHQGNQLEVPVSEAIRFLTSADVRRACDIMHGIYERSQHQDGRVSIEVDPRSAHATEKTIIEARYLQWLVDRPNVLIKIPATDEGLPAITEVLSHGISVNVTLIFGLKRYEQVIEAFLTGLERARDNGHDLSTMASVASFFVSRVDTEVDKRLEKIGSEEARALRGEAAIANARLAYELFEKSFDSDRWRRLEAAGAHKQRPLWASTGVKDPAYDDTRYVVELVAADIVNTMPEATLEALYDHGKPRGDTITSNYDNAQDVFARLAAVGIDMDDVIAVLEREGVEKFIDSWESLLETMSAALSKA